MLEEQQDSVYSSSRSGSMLLIAIEEAIGSIEAGMAAGALDTLKIAVASFRGEVSLPDRVAELIARHGSLRAAARVLDCDAGYLARLAAGEKTAPGKILLRRMGLRRIVTFERTAPVGPMPTPTLK